MTTSNVLIVDLGRGPQLAGQRLTILDIFFYLHRGYDFDFIQRAMPSLTREQFAVVLEYVQEHHAELVEKDRRIEEFHQNGMAAQHAQGGIFAASDENLTTAERVARLEEKKKRKQAEKNGARHSD
jgi:hypothetical protein